MKPTLTTYLLCVIIILSFKIDAQEIDTLNNEETILKIDHSYRKGQIKWLNENGFKTDSYHWEDSEINLYLDKSLNSRSASNILGAAGGTIFVMGLLANFMGSLSHDISNNDPDETYQVIKGPYYIGGAMIVTSVALSFDSLAKLKKAKNARGKKF